MNSKRRAELQRKLSMSAVPRPPAGLSDRIKGDIPQYLAAEPERTRFAGSVAFSMRVAASILLLITTAFVTLRLLEPKHQPAMMAARNADQVMPAMTRYSEGPAAKAAAPQAPASEEVRLDIAQEMPVPPAALRAAPAAPRQMVDLRAEEDAPARRDAARNEAHDRAVDGEAAGSAGDFIVDAMQETTIAAAAPAPAPQAAEAPASAPAGDQPERAKRAAAPSLVSEAYASGLALGPKSEVFGISVDPHSFLDIKSAIENGARPPAGMVNVDALVNYFAGAPVHPPRRGASLEVEASPGPAQADGDQALLRFSVDTPKVTLAERSSTPPAAQDARLEIEIDDDAVASFRRIGGSTTMPPESTLLHNVSVTGLYQLELRPHLKASQHVATVRLRYRSVTDGKEQVLTRVIRGRDLAKDWARASRRHRLASLGAVWSESLKTAVAGNEGVAKRAEELALQKPGDARARELANAVNATAGGGR
jgi:hypothetical protein